jgi:polyisoprenoid-binding protein YceI
MTTEANATEAVESALVHCRLTPGQSRFRVQAFAEGLLSAFGHDPILEAGEFSGDVEFIPETFSDATVKLSVKASSLRVTNIAKEKDRDEIERTLRDSVLETGKYKDITFRSTRVTVARLADKRYRATIVGDVSLHGMVQNNLWISAEVTVNENNLQARGEFPLKQKDFGIKPVSVAGGTLKVKNEVKCSFDVTVTLE